MSARRILGTVVGLAVAGGLVTCGDDLVQPSTAGWLDVRLTSPNPDDGGILFTVSGAVIDSVRSAFPNAFVRRESGSAVRVLIAGDLAPGTVAQIHVPDTRQRAAYQATVVEVAARGTFVQRSAAPYLLTLEPPPSP